MHRFLRILLAGSLLSQAPRALVAQEPGPPAVDSIAVEGQARLTPSQIIGSSGIIVHQPINAPSPLYSEPASSTMSWWNSGTSVIA
jgi:hypothetical protein